MDKTIYEKLRTAAGYQAGLDGLNRCPAIKEAWDEFKAHALKLANDPDWLQGYELALKGGDAPQFYLRKDQLIPLGE